MATKADDIAGVTPQPAAHTPGKRGEFSLGWKVLVAGIIGVACGASPIPFNVIGFTIAPLTQEFGWTKTEILTPITIFGVVVAGTMWLIRGWHRSNLVKHKDELDHLLAIARTDKH